jgi:hypothetical protein
VSTSEKLFNIGPKSAAWLRQVGIRSHAQLVEAGALGAFIKIKRAGFRPSLNLLYALEGAILGCHWRQLPEGRRGELLIAADAAGATAPPIRGKAPPPAEPVRTIYADDDPRNAGSASFGEPALFDSQDSDAPRDED